MATSEVVVLQHGREGGGGGCDKVAAVCITWKARRLCQSVCHGRCCLCGVSAPIMAKLQENRVLALWHVVC